MPHKMIVAFICAIGFIMPVGFALMFIGMPKVTNVDPGLPQGFIPIGELKVYYLAGG